MRASLRAKHATVYDVKQNFSTCGFVARRVKEKQNPSWCTRRTIDGCSRMWDGRVPEGGDMRCNNCSESLCVRLKSDDTLQQIWAGFLSTLPVVCPSKPKPPKPIDVMANFLRGAGSVSGGEWHMDEMGGDMLTPSKEVCMQQMKCLTYLDDMHSQNAPFTMLIDYNRSHMADQAVLASQISSALGRSHGTARAHRFHDESIANAVQEHGAFVLELHAPAGSVICFDSGNIHRAKPLHAGMTRSALTVYFAPVRANSCPEQRSPGSLPHG